MFVDRRSRTKTIFITANILYCIIICLLTKDIVSALSYWFLALNKFQMLNHLGDLDQLIQRSKEDTF